jgi:hypothetical protein
MLPIWRVSILFSIISHSHRDLSDSTTISNNNIITLLSQIELRDTFIDEIISDTQNQSEHTPSYYLSKILLLELSKIIKIRRYVHVFKSLSIGFIRSGVSVLIDAFDQTLTEVVSDNLDIWRNAQIGLVLASHYLNSENHHI